MNAIALLIIEAAVKYGIPFALQAIETLNKTQVTMDDWNSLFALAKTPLGVTPDLTILGPITDLGVIESAVPPPSPDSDVPSTAIVIVKRTMNPVGYPAGAVILCNAAGNCWVIYSMSAVTVNGNTWTVKGGPTFWLAPSAR